MPEHATLAPPICRLAGEVLSIGRRVTQKGVVATCYLNELPTYHFEIATVVDDTPAVNDDIKLSSVQ